MRQTYQSTMIYLKLALAKLAKLRDTNTASEVWFRTFPRWIPLGCPFFGHLLLEPLLKYLLLFNLFVNFLLIFEHLLHRLVFGVLLLLQTLTLMRFGLSPVGIDCSTISDCVTECFGMSWSVMGCLGMSWNIWVCLGLF